MALDLASLGVDLARVHILWGTSKDFGSSGIRMVCHVHLLSNHGEKGSSSHQISQGCVISQDNPQVRTAVGMMTTTQTSSLASIATAGLLTSPELPRLIQLNTTRLSSAYKQVTTWLKAHDVPFVPATHGVYVLARLAPNARSWEDEEEVVRRLKDAGVLLLAGRGFHMREKGWVRMTIAVEPHVLTQALSRITTELKLRRKAVRPRVNRGRVLPEPVELEAAVVNKGSAQVHLMAPKRRRRGVDWKARPAKKRP